MYVTDKFVEQHFVHLQDMVTIYLRKPINGVEKGKCTFLAFNPVEKHCNSKSNKSFSTHRNWQKIENNIYDSVGWYWRKTGGNCKVTPTAGADVNYSKVSGMTPLMLTSSSQYMQGIRLPLGTGVDINEVDNRGYTALLFDT